jgi:transposase
MNALKGAKERPAMKNIMTQVAAIGIDLGDRESHYACVQQEGHLLEEGRVAMSISSFQKAFSVFEPTRIAIEAGAQSRWVAKVLEELGHEVIVANPRQVQLISANNSKNDANDAKLLAKLARVDPELLSPLKHRPESDQTALLAIRARAQLVKTRTALMHSMRGMVKCYGIRLPHADSASFCERCRLAVPAALLPQLEGVFKIVQELSLQIAAYDELVEAIAKTQYPAVEKLREVPGIGTLTALTYVTTLADPKRFRSSRDVGAFLGLRPRQQQSGSKNPQLGITKAGDVYLRTLLVQSAHCVLRKYAPDTALKRWGEKLCERGGANAKKRAIAAVARKLAVLLHKLWITGAEFQAFPASR